jgi:hypothetical protein
MMHKPGEFDSIFIVQADLLLPKLMRGGIEIEYLTKHPP